MDTEDNELLSQIGRGAELDKPARRARLKYIFVRLSFRFFIFVAGIAGASYAYKLPDNSYAQSLACNLASGLLIYLLIAPALKTGHKHPKATFAIGALFGMALLFVASLTSNATQSLLLNSGVGVFLVLALELIVNRLLDVYAAAQASAQQRIDEAADMVRAAQSGLDYKYAIHDYLGIPRPYGFGGIAIPEGTTFFEILGIDADEDT